MLVRMLRVAVLVCTAVAASAADASSGKAFKVGQAVPLQCKDWETGEWADGPTCKETGRALGFSYGLDNFLYCGVELSTAAQYARLAAMVSQSAAWHCRVAAGADAASWVPFVLPLWGVVEGDHLHLDNRVNFALHADGGRVVAAAAYPVRDKFQFVKQQGVQTVALHGPVRWFDRGSYTPLAGAAPGEAAAAAGAAAAQGAACGPLAALLWAAASASATLMAAAVYYQRSLKPAVIRRCLKAR